MAEVSPPTATTATSLIPADPAVNANKPVDRPDGDEVSESCLNLI